MICNYLNWQSIVPNQTFCITSTGNRIYLRHCSIYWYSLEKCIKDKRSGLFDVFWFMSLKQTSSTWKKWLKFDINRYVFCCRKAFMMNGFPEEVVYNHCSLMFHGQNTRGLELDIYVLFLQMLCKCLWINLQYHLFILHEN